MTNTENSERGYQVVLREGIKTLHTDEWMDGVVDLIADLLHHVGADLYPVAALEVADRAKAQYLTDMAIENEEVTP